VGLLVAVDGPATGRSLWKGAQMRRNSRLVAAGTALAMSLTLSGVVAASAATSSPVAAKTSPSSGSTQAEAKDAGTSKGLDQVAKDRGISVQRLDQALRAVKSLLGQNGGTVADPAVLRAFAAGLGISTAKAAPILQAVFGSGTGPGKPGPVDKPGGSGNPAPVFTAQRLAALLGVPVPSAQTALDSLMRLAAASHGVDPQSAAFKAIAGHLGVTPQQLADAIDRLKAATG
jgi:hypothetical protein